MEEVQLLLRRVKEINIAESLLMISCKVKLQLLMRMVKYKQENLKMEI